MLIPFINLTLFYIPIGRVQIPNINTQIKSARAYRQLLKVSLSDCYTSEFSLCVKVVQLHQSVRGTYKHTTKRKLLNC